MLDTDGSSPRSRGTHQGIGLFPGQVRFIPAVAGNTVDRCAGCDASPVHPRGRGEHQMKQIGYVANFGSSPRSRGTPKNAVTTAAMARFIPAVAGNTVTFSSLVKSIPVHPRGRGEHSAQTARAPMSYGSSPRSRGTPRTAFSSVFACRFIPAVAGNTSAEGSRPVCSTVHPRGRGEHYPLEDFAEAMYGSSPRSRGTQAYSE